MTDLGVGDGQGVHPHPPAPPLVLDGVAQQDAQEGVDHLRDLLLLTVLRLDVAEGQQPFLPEGALQETPGGRQGGVWVNPDVKATPPQPNDLTSGSPSWYQTA